MRVQIELEFVPSIFLASFLDDFSNVNAASDSRIMVSPTRRGSSVTRLTLATQNRSAAAFRLLNVGHESLKRLLGLGRHDGTMRGLCWVFVEYRCCSGKLVSIMTAAGIEYSLGTDGLPWNIMCLVILGMSFGVLYIYTMMRGPVGQ